MMPSPRPVSGTGAAANWFEQVRKYFQQFRLLPGPGYNIRQYSNGYVIDLPLRGGGSGASVQVQRMRVKVVGGDSLTCVTWNGSVEGTSNQTVMKPSELRHSNSSEVIEGKSVSYAYSARANNLDGQRVATSTGDQDQVEIVIPTWRVDSIIYAITVPNVLDESTMLDLNVAARAWCQIG